MKSYDVLVIGAGPAGYVAAIRAAQLGFNTACIEKWIGPEGKPALGGTCLNVGCIPSKALLDSSEHYHRVKHDLSAHGITTGDVSIDVPTMIGHKDKIVKQLTDGIAGLFRKNKIDWLQGSGQLMGDQKVSVTAADGESEVASAKYVIIATGSVPFEIPAAKVDDEMIVDSTGALDFQEVPKRLGVIGAGVIGLELGSVWNRLGSEVTILEAMPDFLPAVDSNISREANRFLKRQGLDIHLNARVTDASVAGHEVNVTYEDVDGTQSLVVDKLIVAIGRKALTDGLFSENCSLELDARGSIVVDSNFQTSEPGVYAIGDVIGGPMLAHLAEEEGVALVEKLAGQHSHVNYEVIPWVIYTWPEIAWVGRTEQQVKADGIEYKIGSFPFAANGRAKAMEQTGGMVKIICDAKTDQILGVHIFGAYASELIGEAVVAMEFKASSEDLARTIHAHPSLSEVVHEAALAVDKRALHI